jgi:hypothetical protein
METGVYEVTINYTKSGGFEHLTKNCCTNNNYIKG